MIIVILREVVDSVTMIAAHVTINDSCSLASTSSSESDLSEMTKLDVTVKGRVKEDDNVKVHIKYGFFEFKPVASQKQSLAICKLCQKMYKFTTNSKGNLLKHLQTSHSINLHNHKEEQAKVVSSC